jgi:hypothetical protein
METTTDKRNFIQSIVQSTLDAFFIALQKKEATPTMEEDTPTKKEDTPTVKKDTPTMEEDTIKKKEKRGEAAADEEKEDNAMPQFNFDDIEDIINSDMINVNDNSSMIHDNSSMIHDDGNVDVVNVNSSMIHFGGKENVFSSKKSCMLLPTGWNVTT